MSATKRRANRDARERRRAAKPYPYPEEHRWCISWMFPGSWGGFGLRYDWVPFFFAHRRPGPYDHN